MGKITIWEQWFASVGFIRNMDIFMNISNFNFQSLGLRRHCKSARSIVNSSLRMAEIKALNKNVNINAAEKIRSLKETTNKEIKNNVQM